MKMKKGKQIKQVIITNGIVTAIDSDGDNISLSRSQRQILTNHKSSEYIKDIQKEWQNRNAIHDDFTVVKDGKVVYTYTK